MTIKDSALLAFFGTLLLSVVLVWRLVMDILNVVQGLSPALTVLSSLIYAFAAISVTCFFFVFQRQHS